MNINFQTSPLLSGSYYLSVGLEVLASIKIESESGTRLAKMQRHFKLKNQSS